ncbi:MAG: hypothetical protein JW804_08695 [Sedimentisphaerales bacterium]|nr:hypothetical protein [Sedimentisphaerales bacterium]
MRLINPANSIELTTWALIDTGADNTVIPAYIARQLYHDVSHRSVKTDICQGIGGQAKVYKHTFRLNILGTDKKGKVDYGKVAIRINKKLFSVVEGLHAMVLGEDDFLKKYILTINYPRKTFSLRRP